MTADLPRSLGKVLRRVVIKLEWRGGGARVPDPDLSDLPFCLCLISSFLGNQKRGKGLVSALKSQRPLSLFFILEAKCVIRNLYWVFGKSTAT